MLHETEVDSAQFLVLESVFILILFFLQILNLQLGRDLLEQCQVLEENFEDAVTEEVCMQRKQVKLLQTSFPSSALLDSDHFDEVGL